MNRQIAHKALKMVDGVMQKAMASLAKGETLTDDEALLRFQLLHEGNPAAMVQFASQAYLKRPRAGTNPLQMADEYERRMLALKEQGDGNG